jgi:hypothetical protein
MGKRGLAPVSARLLEGEVLGVTRGISSKFVPKSSIDEIESDLIEGI